MIHIGDRRCRKAGGREDGEGTALAGHHKLSVTTMTVTCFLGLAAIAGTGWFGLGSVL